METSVKCQKCDMEIQAKNLDSPCENCGEKHKKYIVVLNARLGLKATITDKILRITSNSLYALIILGAFTAGIISLFEKQLSNYLPLWLTNNLTLWIIVFGVGIVIIVLLIAFPRMYVIGKLRREEVKFHWKSCEQWFSITKPGLTILLFAFISLYLLMNIAKPLEPQLNIDLIIISATLGGLVLTAASFMQGEKQRIQLMYVARLFILSTILLILFIVTYSLLRSPTFNPSEFVFDRNWIVKEVIFFVFVIGGLFGGTYSFSKAIVNLFDLIWKESWIASK